LLLYSNSFSLSFTKVASSSNELWITTSFMFSNFNYNFCTLLSFISQWYSNFFNFYLMFFNTLLSFFICSTSQMCIISFIIYIYFDFFCFKYFSLLLWRLISIFAVDSFDLECWTACKYTLTFVFIPDILVESALVLLGRLPLFGVAHFGVFMADMTNFFFCWLHNPSLRYVDDGLILCFEG